MMDFLELRNSELGCFDGDFGLEGGIVDKALSVVNFSRLEASE